MPCQRLGDATRLSIEKPRLVFLGLLDLGLLEGQAQGERRAHALGGLDLDLTVVAVDDLLRDGKAHAQAALGTTVVVDGVMPDEEVEIVVPAGCQFDDTVRVSGKGMPRMRRDGRGDLIAHIDVIVPTSLTDEQRELLEKLAHTMDESVDKKRTPWQRIKDALS